MERRQVSEIRLSNAQRHSLMAVVSVLVVSAVGLVALAARPGSQPAPVIGGGSSNMVSTDGEAVPPAGPSADGQRSSGPALFTSDERSTTQQSTTGPAPTRRSTTTPTSEPEPTTSETTEPEPTSSSDPEPTEPTVTVPTVTEPTLTLPTVTGPTITKPTITLPTITMPTLTLPTVTIETSLTVAPTFTFTLPTIDRPRP